jgi:hypothetical protein
MSIPTRTLEQVNADIHSTVARLQDIGDELARAPVWKAATKWYRDRMAHHRTLVDLRERLYRERLNMIREK